MSKKDGRFSPYGLFSGSMMSYFIAGLLTCSIAWRLDQHKYGDIGFPLTLLPLAIILIVLNIKKEKSNDNHEAERAERVIVLHFLVRRKLTSIKDKIMTLGRLIKYLEQQDQTKTMRFGFGKPHSWRGEYDKLAFEPMENVTVAEMLESAKGCVGEIFGGWKGGEFLMTEGTEIHIDYCGSWSDGSQMWKLMLDCMFSA